MLFTRFGVLRCPAAYKNSAVGSSQKDDNVTLISASLSMKSINEDPFVGARENGVCNPYCLEKMYLERCRVFSEVRCGSCGMSLSVRL